MAGPWEKYAQPQRAGGQVLAVPESPDAALNRATKQADLAAKMREAAAWNASHNPDGSPKVQAPSLLGDPTKTGAEYLATLPQNIRGRVQQLLDGRSMLTAREKGQPLGQQLMDAANQADPTFDENVSHARYVERQQYTGQGKGTLTVQAAERLAQHVNDLYAASKKLGGPDLGWAPLSNAVTREKNRFQQPEVASYNTILPIISGELQKLTKLGVATVDESHQIEANLSPSQPENVRYSAIKELVRLGRAQYDPLRQSWESAWQGTTPPPMPMDFSKPTTAIFDNIEAGGDPLPMKRDKQGYLVIPGVTDKGNSNTPNDPSLAPASGPTKTVITQSDTDKKIAAMLAGGVPGAQIKKFVADSGQDYGGKLNSILAWRAVNPKYKGGYDVHGEKIVPTTLANRAAASPLSALPYAIANAGTAGNLDEIKGAVNTVKDGGSLSDNIAAADLEKNTIADSSPGLDLLGNVIGGTGAMVGGGLGVKALLEGGAKAGAGRNLLAWLLKNPIKSAAIGDAGYGAAYGAGENNDNRLLGAAVGAPVAALGSFAGSGLSKAAGATLTGVVNPAAQRLKAAGIPLTVGEVLGGGWKKTQDAMTSIFGPGNMVTRRYADGRKALNKAAFNQAGQVIGAPIDKVGQAGITALDAAKSKAYSDALDPAILNLDTPSFTDPMGRAIDAAKAIPPAELPGGYGADAIKRFVGNQIADDGTMTGPAFQKAYRGLAQTASKVAPKVEGHDIAQALGDAKDTLSSTLADQNPEAHSGFLKANAANRHLSILQDAMKRAQNQVSDGGDQLFTSAQLGSAATANTFKYGGKQAAASGARPFNQLALDAQQVMSSKLPDSGTPMRLLAMTAATGGLTGLGSSAGYTVDGGEGATLGGVGTLGLLTALGTKKGQQLLTAALLKRTIADQLVGRSIRRNPQIGAGILASAGIPLLDSPSR